MKTNRILILSNSSGGLLSFRKELLEAMKEQGYEVIISVPYNKQNFAWFGKNDYEVVATDVDRRGLNIFKDIKLFLIYEKLIKSYNPDYILTYTIKPNIYGSLAAKKNKIKHITNITGMGTAIENNNILSKVLLKLYKKSIDKASVVFFQNEHNLTFFKKKNILNSPSTLLPGSGVNLNNYTPSPIQFTKEFYFIGRLMRNKGVIELLDVIEELKSIDSTINFSIVGDAEDQELLERVKELDSRGILTYFGRQDSVKECYRNATCVINPSYHEGMSNVLLEGAASGRVLIASDIPGCREIIENGKNGYTFEPRSREELKKAILKIASLTLEELNEMGQYSRKKVEKGFSREIVIQEYLKVLGGN